MSGLWRPVAVLSGVFHVFHVVAIGIFWINDWSERGRRMQTPAKFRVGFHQLSNRLPQARQGRRIKLSLVRFLAGSFIKIYILGSARRTLGLDDRQEPLVTPVVGQKAPKEHEVDFFSAKNGGLHVHSKLIAGFLGAQEIVPVSFFHPRIFHSIPFDRFIEKIADAFNFPIVPQIMLVASKSIQMTLLMSWQWEAEVGPFDFFLRASISQMNGKFRKLR
mmetsp:Transcript_17911/g.26530  ORF Transcript_17911/g.26530 Transcript_17911/m.26530 type:complete len:219 (+) Transcript_17911:275-931(+)